MPTYEYECPAGHRYEKREGFDAPASQRCEKCRRTAKRVLYAPPIVFKGSGFYVTDSRKGPSGGDTEAAPATTSGAKSETKADAPAADTSAPSKDAEPAAAG
jgi:putative FmdB family regulatory protein